MANTKFRKSMTSRSKGLIALAVLLALTVFVTWMAVGGMKLDREGVKILLPWVPTSTENWPEALPLSRALGGGTYVEFTVEVPEGAEISLDDAAAQAEKTLRQRVDKLMLTDALLTRTGNVLRLELPNMDAEELSYIHYIAEKPAHLQALTAQNESVMSEHDIQKITYEMNGASYSLVLDVTAEIAQALNDPGGITFMLDDENLAPSFIINGNQVSLPLGNNTSMLSNVLFLLENGSYDGTLTESGEGTVEMDASASGLKVILIAAAVLLAAELIGAVIICRFSGVAAFWAVLCAVIINLFIYATVVLANMTISIAIALIVGIVLACAVLNIRAGAIAKAISAGALPQMAVKTASRATAKKIWLCQTAVLAASIILMLIPAAKLVGYTLASGVFACACSVGLMRIILSCFVTISHKPALFGKVK